MKLGKKMRCTRETRGEIVGRKDYIISKIKREVGSGHQKKKHRLWYKDFCRWNGYGADRNPPPQENIMEEDGL